MKKKKECGTGISVEYTAPNLPQQHGVVERTFATLYGRTRGVIVADRPVR